MHLLAAREMGVRLEECLAIEDSPVGIKAALAAGMEAVAVTTELTRLKFRNTDILEGSHIVDDPRTLSAVVRSLKVERPNPPWRRSEAPITEEP